MRFILLMLLAVTSSSVTAQVSSGTAFAVASGLLVTNQHVIAGCSSIVVITSDGRRVGSVVDADAQIDLALLRVTGIKGATARLRNPRNIRLGESVMVFGFPLAGSLSSGGNFTSGLVSGLRGLRDAAGEIQITAPVQPGNSGGPLMDASGLVIGVVQAKLDALQAARITGDIPQNVNFAISLEVLAEFLAKNNIPFGDSAPSASLDTARVAELAQSFTYRIECRGSAQYANSSGIGAAFKHENKPENLKALFELVHQKVHVNKDNKGATALFAGMIPNEARAKVAFKDNLAPDVQNAILDMHKKLNFKEDGAPKVARPTQTVVKVHGAKTEEIIAYRQGSLAHKEFPGGARRVAELALKPGMTFYEVEYLEPGKEAGMKYHLLYWDGKQWSMLGPAWRVLNQ